MKTLALLLLFVSFTVDAQWKKNANGQLVPNDSTLTVKVDNLKQDSAVTPFLDYVPYFTDVTNSQAWMGAAYRRNWYAFSQRTYQKVDSLGWFFVSALAATDSFALALYRLSDSTLIAYTTWDSPNATTSNLVWLRPTNVSVVLEPGKTYAIMWVHNTNTTLPSVPVVTGTFWYNALKYVGMMGCITTLGSTFSSFPATLSSDTAFPGPASVYAPIFIIKSNQIPQIP